MIVINSRLIHLANYQRIENNPLEAHCPGDYAENNFGRRLPVKIWALATKKCKILYNLRNSRFYNVSLEG